MSTVKSPPRPTGTPGKRFSLTDVVTKGKQLPSRVVLHGVEGVGKTSFGAFAPSPIFAMARGETGLETLVDAGRLGDVPHFPEIQTWTELLGIIDTLATDNHPYKTLVIDTLNGCERLCHEHVCARDYRGDWGKEGFTGYMRGYESSVTDWREMLVALDRLREVKRMAILCLCHTKIGAFRNPLGDDYDRFIPAVHPKSWELTSRWADIVLFANFETFTKKDQGRVKGQGGTSRVLYTERTAAYDAKNRHGLPEEISMGAGGQEAWTNFVAAMKGGAK